MVRDLGWAAVALALVACDRPGLLPEGPRLGLSAASLAFQGGHGYDPAPQQVLVTRAAPGDVISGLSVDYGSGPSGWLAVAWSDPSTSPVALTVRPQAGLLPSGTHTATVRIAAAGAANSPVALPVAVAIALPRPVASVAYREIHAPLDGSPPDPLRIAVGNGGGGALPRPVVWLDDGIANPVPWAQASLSGDSEPYLVSVQLTDPRSDATFLWATLHIAAAGQETTVGIAFRPAPPQISLPSETLVIPLPAGAGTTLARTVPIGNAGGGLLVKPTVTAGPAWLTASVSGTAAPFTLDLGIDGSRLPAMIPGDPPPQADLWLSSPSALYAVPLHVRLEVGTPEPVVWAPARRYLTFRALVGDPDPAPSSIPLERALGSASGPPQLVTFAGGVAWFTAGVSGLAEPYALVVQPRLAGLAPGVYSGTATVTSAGSAAPESVSLSLMVEAWRGTSLGFCDPPDAATPLPGGQVLFTGHRQAGAGLACASLFTPIDESWTQVSLAQTVRAEHSATLLADGRVLVAAGIDRASGQETGSWEVYDPESGLWLHGPVDVAARRGHVAALLRDGRVLLAGGRSGATIRADAEVIDPVTGLVSPGPHLVAARAGASAVAFADGRILVAGGLSASGGALASAELFDPVSGSWSLVGAMGTPRVAPALVLLGDGSVLAAGGTDGADPLASAELFVPSSGSWVPTGSMMAARVTRGLLLPSGRVLLLGGGLQPNAPGNDTAESFDPVAGLWSPVPGPPVPLPWGHSPVLLPDGRVLVTGACASASCSSWYGGGFIGRGVAP